MIRVISLVDVFYVQAGHLVDMMKEAFQAVWLCVLESQKRERAKNFASFCQHVPITRQSVFVVPITVPAVVPTGFPIEQWWPVVAQAISALVTSALAVLEAAVYSTGFSSMDIKIVTMLMELALQCQ